ncbi:MAG: D-alanine--D-alanine ligase [Bacteroidota bacterium]
MRIGLIYDLHDDYPWLHGDPPDADAEYEPPETVDALAAAVEALGHEPVRIGTAHDLLKALPTLRLDAALTIAEGFGTRNREAWAPVLLELVGVPQLGSDALTLSLSVDKAWTKDLAQAAGVPTPPYRVYPDVDALDDADLPAPFPLFVKPRYEGTAKGITAASRVHTWAALREQVAWVTETYRQDALVEAFVMGGGEFTVAVVGHNPPQALPVLQRAVETTTRIGLHALEVRGGQEDWPYEVEGTLAPALEAHLHALSLRVFHKLSCRDFARLDFRVDAAGQPWFLEINTLPTFAPDGTFAIVAELMGQPYPAWLAGVLRQGLVRLGLVPPEAGSDFSAQR